MGLIISGIVLLFTLFMAKRMLTQVKIPAPIWAAGKLIAALMIVLGGFNGMFFYAEPGYKYHVRTITGEEKMVADVGYNTYTFGRVNAWKNAMTVQSTDLGGNSVDAESESSTSSADIPPQTLVFLDQVDAKVTATVRYRLPSEEDAFLRMAREYRTPDNLLLTELIPAFKETLGANAALMGAEEYFSGAKTQFNNDFENQMRDGVIEVRRKQVIKSRLGRRTGSANAALGEDQEGFGDDKEIVFEVTRILDSNGQPRRKEQAFARFGVGVVSARVTDVIPNEAFQGRMRLKQESSANRAIAQERRAQEVQERFLAIEKGEREVAQKQAEAKVRQIELTTNAETDKQLALTDARKRKEQAAIDRDTAEIRLEQTQIDAEARKVAADAEAYEKTAILEADNALQIKADAYVEVQKVWAEAFATRKVPTTVFMGTGSTAGVPGSDNDVSTYLKLKTVQAANDLNVDMSIRKGN